MPWAGQDITEQRKQFVVRAVSRNGPFKEICGIFGISRKTGYKWASRYEELGNLRDLKERSRRPHQVPNKTTPDIEGNVLALRDHAGWGARRLAAALRQQNIQLAKSTVHNILRRNKRIEVAHSNWAAWIIQVLLANDPLPQLQREFPNAVELSHLAHFIRNGKLRERKKAMAVVASLKRIPVRVTAKSLQTDTRAVTRYFNHYASGGITELFRRRKAIGKKDDEQDRQFLFSVLHSPPSAHGINRTSWKMDDLHRVLAESGHRMSDKRIRGMIKTAGFRWRKAKVVLTSTDPDYRAKLDEIENILSHLKEDEAFRHANATLMSRFGAQLKLRQQRLGHVDGSPVTETIYTRVVSENGRRVAEMVRPEGLSKIRQVWPTAADRSRSAPQAALDARFASRTR